MVTNADYIREASFTALAKILKPSQIGLIHHQPIPLFSISDNEMPNFEADFKNTNKYEFLFG